MKSFGVFLLLLCLSIPAMGQSPKPEPAPGLKPRIEGPALAVPGQEVRLSVMGLTTPPLSEGLAKLQEWSQKVSIEVNGPDGTNAIADTDLSLGFGAQSVRFRVFFTADVGGIYVLIVHDGNADQIATKRITVGPVNPPPPPGPTPVPVVSGRRIILLVREAKEVSPKMNLTELDLTSGDSWKYLKEKKHDLLILSDDRPMPTNYPPIVQAAFQKAKGLKMPSLAIIDAASLAELFVEGINPDSSAQDVLNLIKKYGG